MRRSRSLSRDRERRNWSPKRRRPRTPPAPPPPPQMNPNAYIPQPIYGDQQYGYGQVPNVPYVPTMTNQYAYNNYDPSQNPYMAAYAPPPPMINQGMTPTDFGPNAGWQMVGQAPDQASVQSEEDPAKREGMNFCFLFNFFNIVVLKYV